MTLGHRIAVFNEGRIEQVGRPLDLYAWPANRFVAGFLGSPKMNLVPVTIGEVSAGQTQLKLPDCSLLVLAGAATGVRAGDAATLGFRPNQAALQAVRGYPAGALTGRVELIERLGHACACAMRRYRSAPGGQSAGAGAGAAAWRTSRVDTRHATGLRVRP
jgi:multiple sugar transport system ATP-binding protein